MRQVQDMVEGSMALSGKENSDNRMYYIAVEIYDSGRHVVGLVYEGTVQVFYCVFGIDKG
jgi:hypothetical protein